jgi:hypothetical protein
MGFDQFASFPRMSFEVALVLKLRAHITRRIAIAFALPKSAWFAGLFGSLSFVLWWAGTPSIVVSLLHDDAGGEYALVFSAETWTGDRCSRSKSSYLIA